ncbi:cuticle protein-like [Schistocerca serialis cubense]|uniref:cuticle protein-like n=2 Tax=Schistocerca TaxID=7008 RepID=UPI00214ECDEB|nr:cuticle protein-like [Schistocerca serialis cubense]
MKLLVVLCSVVAACAGQVLLYPAPLLRYNHLAPLVAPISTQFRAQDELGQFTFATAGDNQGRVESKSLDGAVRGAYSYVDPTGKLVNVQYVADDNGFRVVGANNLPEARSSAPAPVSDTPEVVAARALFQKQYEEAARAAEASAEQTLSRRRRQAVLPVPVLLPAARTTVKVARYEPVDAAVPASTRKVELKEKEEEVLAAAPVPLPLAYAVPAVPAAPKAKVHQLEAVDAAVPAATRKLEVKEKEAELVPLLPLPAARFVVL